MEGEFPGGDDWLPCSAPIGVLCAKFGVQRVLPVAEGGKEAVTEFRRRHFDAERQRSLVECRPMTGRTHQIRLHLQFLGHPIANDPIYNCEAWGPNKGKAGDFGKPLEEVVAALGEVHSQTLHVLGEGLDLDLEKAEDPKEAEEPQEKRMKLQEGLYQKDPFCRGCRTVFKDPEPENLQLFLHAFQYQGPEWSYRTELPAWANFEN